MCSEGFLDESVCSESMNLFVMKTVWMNRCVLKAFWMNLRVLKGF